MDNKTLKIRNLESDLSITRRQVGDAVASYQSSKDEASKLVWLERALEKQKQVVAISKEITELRDPCQKCGRKVASPCHDVANYRQNGPWDRACLDVFTGDA